MGEDRVPGGRREEYMASTHGDDAAAVAIVPAGASPSATRVRAGERRTKMGREMSILPFYTGRTTSMPPRLSLLIFTIHHGLTWSCH
jgi:hypothetical protein